MTDFAVAYRRMSKPREVEGLGDLYLVRPTGALLVGALRRVPRITPTTVSILSVVAAWWCAWLYYRNGMAGVPTLAAVWGAAAMLLYSGLDSADGQLARLTGSATDVGRLVDGLCDNLAFTGIYLGILFGYIAHGGAHPWAVFALGCAAGASHAMQASLSEYARLVYQAYVGGRYALDRHRPEHIEAAIRAATGRLGVVFHAWYMGYCRQQRLLAPTTGRLEERIRTLRDERPELVHDLPRLWQRHQSRRVRDYWLIAPNVHKTFIVAAAFIPVWGDGFFAGLGPAWFYFTDLALNVPMLWLIRRQARVDARVAAELDAREQRA